MVKSNTNKSGAKSRPARKISYTCPGDGGKSWIPGGQRPNEKALSLVKRA